MEGVAEKFQGVYDYIISEETAFRTNRVPLSTNWRDWNMFEHVDRSFTLKNSRFYQGQQDYTRPFNNIILPIANVNYRTEGFDVKDAELYVDNAENYHKSFMARKFHNWWAKENHIDTAIDESVESYFDYGLSLLKNVNESRPEVIDLKDIAFCDQTNILAGPICLKHHYSINELLDMKGRWYDKEIDKAVTMSRFNKTEESSSGEKTKTPGKYIEVYELHGVFPESWLGVEKLGEEWQDTGKYSPQIHIVTYYSSPSNGVRTGVCLFKGKEPKPIFKALVRDPIHGRACGRGGIEELFHPQIWTNYSELHIHQMLEAVAKVILVTDSKKFKNQKYTNMKQGQVLELEEGKRIEQLAIQPINKAAFDNAVDRWGVVARSIGSASELALGLNPTSGTPLGTTEIVNQEGQGIHDYRKGKIADFWQEVYRDWVLPHFSTEINKGSKWLDELSLEELQGVADKVATKEANKRIKRLILSGKILTKEEIDQFRAITKEAFMKGGEKRFLEVIKDEFKDLPMDVEISIANKKENLYEMVSKLNGVFRSVFTPAGIQVLQSNPQAGELLNEILEKSGLSPRNFAGSAPQPMQAQGQPAQPMELPTALPVTA